jgi:hypothetical protein
MTRPADVALARRWHGVTVIELELLTLTLASPRLQGDGVRAVCALSMRSARLAPVTARLRRQVFQRSHSLLVEVDGGRRAVLLQVS